MNKNQQEQYEKDIESVIRFLKLTDPENATREHAIEMLGNMESLAHLVAHKVLDESRNYTSDTYDQIAIEYERAYFDDQSDIPYIDKLLVLLNEGSTILDVGCGVGNFSKYISGKGFNVIGIDLSEGMLNIAKSRATGLDFQIMDMRRMTFHDSSFDAILSAYSLIHIPSEEINTVLQEYNRVLKPQGKILIAVQEGQSDRIIDEPLKPGEKIFVNFFNLDNLVTQLKNSGFNILISETKKNHDSTSLSDTMIYVLAEKSN